MKSKATIVVLGEKITRQEYDRRISAAKIEHHNQFIEDHGYIFCERCKKNVHFCQRNSASHIVSTKECINMGMPELAYSIDNLERLGYPCHMKIEVWPNPKRLSWYKARLQKISFREFIFNH